MLRLIAWRLTSAVPMLFGIVLLVFVLFQFSRIDPAGAMLGENATADQVRVLRERLGLEQPFFAQIASWFAGVFRGDLGTSYRTGDAVAGNLAARLPVTLSVLLGGMVIACLLGVGLGILSGTRPGSLTDRAVTVLVSANLAVPGFWVGLLLALAIGVWLRWLPAAGYVPFSEDPVRWARCMALPCIAAGINASAVIARQTRSALLETFGKPFIRALRARGIPRVEIIGRYALRDTAAPVVTTIGMEVSRVIGISLVVEQVFALPGLGTYLVDAVVFGDRPVLISTVAFVGVFIVLTFLVVDVVLALLNPRVRPQ